METIDVIVVGAGISGIGAGYHLQTQCPERTYAILEGRDSIGGTWDLFRYPGVRSDSDMYTLGYAFRPWQAPRAIADGPAILEYLKETAEEFGIDRKIRYGHRVVSAEWQSDKARWVVGVDGPDGHITVQCRFLFMCTGYYNYARGYTPEFPGSENFAGQIVHPQAWPEDLDYSNQQVVVIGSGATAVTLVPAMADTAAHVTMLQRTPTWVVSRPGEDGMANWLNRNLPPKLASGIIRWRNILFGMYFFRMCRKAPERVRQMLLKGLRQELDSDAVDTHFTPDYNPWDQRLCLVPDGDLFKAIRDERASVVTDHIERFDETGICLKSGKRLPADIIVTATGLDMQLMSNIPLKVDGEAVDPAATLSYKGMMFSNIPNLAVSFGYTNASWTLKCDLTCEYVCKLLNHMQAGGYGQCTPRYEGQCEDTEPFIDFSSGYVQRGVDRFPRQGPQKPWKVYQNYLLDRMALGASRLDDGVMEFR